MTIMIAAAAAALAAAPPQTADPQWVDLFELPDGAMTWYDPASVVRGDGGIRVRMRARPGRSAPAIAREFNSIEEIDCRRREARTIMLVADMENGESVTVPMDEEEAEAINPNSPLAALHAIVCPPTGV